MTERRGGEVWPPVVVARREVAGARRITAVGERWRARRGNVSRDVIVGQQHLLDPGGVVGFVVAKPTQFGRRERCDQDTADSLRAAGRPAPLLDEVNGRVGGAGVVPEQRIADWHPVRVQRDHPVLLPTDRDSSRPVDKRRRRLVVRREPSARVNLGATRMGRDPALDDRAVVGIHKQRFGRLCGGVHTKDKRHVPIKYES